MRLDGEDWRRFFDSYRREAFRLEVLPGYTMPSERSEYATFLATGDLHIPADDQWLVRVRQFRRAGRWVGRVHVISGALTDYLRYEFAVYRHTVAAGEDVRILDLSRGPDPGLPKQDFRLFDDRAVVLMRYDASGRQLSRELLDGADPAPYVAWKHAALAAATPFAEYYATLEV